MRREERYRGVAPVVDLPRWTVLLVELEDREQFDGRDTEFLEVGNSVDESCVRAAGPFIHARIRMSGEAPDMHLVNDRVRRRAAKRGVSLPVVSCGVDDHALHRRGRVAARATRE